MTARTMYMATLILYRAAVCGLLVAVSVTLTGCAKDSERTLILVEPISGCQYVGTTYGGNPIISGSYIKPRTDARGRHVCEKGGV